MLLQLYILPIQCNCIIVMGKQYILMKTNYKSSLVAAQLQLLCSHYHSRHFTLLTPASHHNCHHLPNIRLSTTFSPTCRQTLLPSYPQLEPTTKHHFLEHLHTIEVNLPLPHTTSHLNVHSKDTKLSLAPPPIHYKINYYTSQHFLHCYNIQYSTHHPLFNPQITQQNVPIYTHLYYSTFFSITHTCNTTLLLLYPHYMNHITTSSWMLFHNMSNLYSTHHTLLHCYFNPTKPHPFFTSMFKSQLDPIHHYNLLTVNASSHCPLILNVCPSKLLKHKPPISYPRPGILSIKTSSKTSQP